MLGDRRGAFGNGFGMRAVGYPVCDIYRLLELEIPLLLELSFSGVGWLYREEDEEDRGLARSDLGGIRYRYTTI